MSSITFQKSAKKDFGESDKKLGFIRTLRFPYGIITIHLCYNKYPPPPLYSGKGRFSFLWYVQLKHLKLAKMLINDSDREAY